MNKGIVIAGIIGLGAVGLGAYALTRGNSNSNSQQTSSSDAFSGFTGGGATGSNSGKTVADTISTVLQDVFSNTGQTDAFSEIIPAMQAMQNPSDEASDVKQVSYVGNPVTYVGSNLQQVMSTLGTSSKKGKNLLTLVNKDQNTSTTTTPAEYNQGNSFAPAPKQADMSSYNEQKTGGSTENTSKQTTEKKDSSTKTSGNNQYAGYEYIGGVINSVGDAVGGITGWW